MKQVRNSEAGLSQMGLLLTALIVGAGFYCAVQVVPFYLNYFEIEGHFEAQAQKAAINTDDQIRKFLASQVRKMNVPLEETDIKILRQGEYITIEAPYEEYLTFEFGEDIYHELWIFKFHPRIHMKYTK